MCLTAEYQFSMMCQSVSWGSGGGGAIGRHRGHCSIFQTTWPDLSDNRGIRDLIQPWWKVLDWNGKLNMLHYIIVVLESELGSLRLESRRGRECHCRWRSDISGSHIKWLWRKNKCRRGLMEHGVLRDEDDDRWGHTDWRRRDEMTGGGTRRSEAGPDDRRRDETTGGGTRRDDRRRDGTTGGETGRPEAGRDETTGGETRRPEAGPDDLRRDQTTGSGTGRPEAGPDDRRLDETTGGRTGRPKPGRDDKRWEDDTQWQEEVGQGDLRCDVTTRQAEHGDRGLEAGGWRWLPKAGGDGPKWDVMAGRGFDDRRRDVMAGGGGGWRQCTNYGDMFIL